MIKNERINAEGAESAEFGEKKEKPHPESRRVRHAVKKRL